MQISGGLRVYGLRFRVSGRRFQGVREIPTGLRFSLDSQRGNFKLFGLIY